MTKEWCYGWNMPGYLPDTAEACETWTGARDALIWELERLDEGDSTGSAADIDHVIAVLAGAQVGEPIDVRCGLWNYFVALGDA
jgi:hypothetical protein